LLGDLELLKLQRYESHLGRELSRLFKHLHQLQDRRRVQPGDPAVPATPCPQTTGSLPSSLPGSAVPPASPPVPTSPPAALPSSPALPATQVSRPVPMPPRALHAFLQNELPPQLQTRSRASVLSTAIPALALHSRSIPPQRRAISP
jgi:hypothetical protein